MIGQPYRPVTYMMGSNASGGMMPAGSMGTMGSMGSMGTPGTMGTMGTMGTVPPQVTSGSPMTPTGTVVPTTAPVFEQSYIENIFRLNLGKIGTFYYTYENNKEWNAKIYKGVLEAAGRDHIIISDPATGQRTVLLMVNFDYATFDEPLVYQYPGVIGNPPTRNWR
nr:spore coat protein GerQ [Paenibacillus ihuae]